MVVVCAHFHSRSDYFTLTVYEKDLASRVSHAAWVMRPGHAKFLTFVFSGLKYQLKQIESRKIETRTKIFIMSLQKVYWNDRRDSLTFRSWKSVLFLSMNKWIYIKSLNWDHGEEKSPVKIFCKYWPHFFDFRRVVWLAFSDWQVTRIRNFQNYRGYPKIQAELKILLNVLNVFLILEKCRERNILDILNMLW